MKTLKRSPINIALATALAASFFASNAMAVSDAEYNELKAQVNELATQAEQAQSSSAKNKTTVGGYGELHYNNLSGTKNGVAGANDKQEIDFHRFVLFFGHEFNEKIRFFSEVELEHANTQQSGVVELEQAYIEMDLMGKKFQNKTGVILVPVGIINETHEPPTFYGVERNPVEKNIVPVTWYQGGTAFNANFESGISYDLMIGEGLNSADGYTVRGGRQQVSKAKAKSLSYTGRVKYTGVKGLEIALTANFQDDMTQGDRTNGSAASATLLETHAIYNIQDFTLKALYAQWDIGGSNAKANNADKQSGYYIEPSYKLNENWGVFGRYNAWNNTTDSKNEETQMNVGFSYWPHPDVVFKADYVNYKKNTTAKNEYSGFNLGMGYQF